LETYPSGRVVITGYDAANRVSSVNGNFAGQQTAYASGVSYAPHGAPKSRKMTAREVLAQYIKGSVRSEFPSGYDNMSFDEIDRLASQGNGEAQTARKLLTDSRFWK
jgi:hypothetical protein